MSIQQQKSFTRSEFKELNRKVDPSKRNDASSALCQSLTSSDCWQLARAILFFFPLPDEPDISPALTDALGSNKIVALPRFNPGTGEYEAARITSLAQDLYEGQFRVMEPSASCPVISLKQLDLTLVPGLAFDPSGRRLGRGKGFYDRLLPGTAGVRLGLAFDWQVSEVLPTEPHDVVLDAILTPTRWLKAIQSRAR